MKKYITTSQQKVLKYFLEIFDLTVFKIDSGFESVQGLNIYRWAMESHSEFFPFN